jgi:opacity protein-like surface antigen
MNMRRNFIAGMMCLLLAASPAFAQKHSTRYQEFGIFLGGSYYLGDLNRAHLNSLTQPAGGVVYRYNFNPRFDIKANLLFGSVKGDDSQSGVNSQITRNLAFKSPITELAAELEFNFLEYTLGNSKTPWTPYVFGGLAGFRFNPQAEIGDNYYNLQPLGTEGQGTSANSSKKYKLTQVSLPFGLGVKFTIARMIGFSVEWGWRKTFTDYIDDCSKTYVDPQILSTMYGPVSAYLSDPSINTDHSQNIGKQRGDSSTKDWYSFAGIMITFKLRAKEKKCYSY